MQYRLVCRHKQILCRRIIEFISLRLQVQTVFVDRFLAHLTIQYARLHELTTCAQLLHRLRLVELLFELLEGAFDVVSLLNLNAEHGNSDWAPKIRNFRERPP